MPSEERSQLRVIGYDLYSGATGVAMFLAALDRLDGAERYRDLALAALAPLREEINCRQRGPRLARSIGIGGPLGWARLSTDWLDRDSFLARRRCSTTPAGLHS
jgi:lantibiotic modifying enzyme